MLTLYHAPRSRSSRILWLLEELGAEYEIVYVDIQRQDSSGAADPHNPHPDKKVPALEHDGALITESIAVTLYLTDLYPEAGLGPAVGDPLRGPYLSWLAYYAGVVEPVIVLSYAALADNPLTQLTFRGRAEVDHRILEVLSNQPYILGNRFSAADIIIASIGQWARDMLPKGDIIDAYLARCNERPALAAAMHKDAKPEPSHHRG